MITPDPAAAPPTFPVTLRVAGRRVLVVGGGVVATRRARGLIDAGARVDVVAPAVTAELAAQVTELALLATTGPTRPTGALTWQARGYTAGDLDGAWLVVTATGDARVDDRVAADADAARVWCVMAGDADGATAWTPAVGRVADVLVAVNAGRDPRRATALRDGIVAAIAAGDLPMRRHRRPPGQLGSVALVGGGPGDPGLITTRGRRLLAEADVVVVDRLAPRALLDDLPADVLVVDVGKSPGDHPVPQDQINAALVEHALAGNRVVRLKGGDPSVFGRGSEEAAACEAVGIPVEVVPGVTSAISVPSALGIPVTSRGLSRGFTVITGHAQIAAVPPSPDHTVVMLMGVARLAATAAELIAAGRDPGTPVAVLEDGYGPRQRATVGTLATIADRAAAAGVRPPAVTVVGDVVRLSPAWRATFPDAAQPDHAALPPSQEIPA